MTTAVIANPDQEAVSLVEHSDIFAYPDAPVTPERILRRLEVLRQRLCIRWRGTPGAFAGFDVLKIEERPAIMSGTVRLRASMVSVLDKSHVVELSATWVEDDSADRVPEPLVVGQGRSLELHI